MENVNESEPNKDKRSRTKIKKCGDEMGKLICKIMGDDRYLNTKQWEEKTKIVKEANNRLDDQQFIRQWLSKLTESSVPENVTSNPCVKNALQEPEWNPILNQDEIYKSLPNSFYKLLEGQTLLEMKEELAAIKEDLMQRNTIADQKQQLMMEGKVFKIVYQMVSKVLDSLSAVMQNIIDTKAANPVGGHLQIQNEQLILHFPPTPDSIQINQKGTNDEIQNPEMMAQEEPAKEVNLTLGFVGERLAKLTLQKTNEEDSRGVDPPIGELPFDLPYLNKCDLALLEDLLGEGTSNARANEANMKLPPEETRMVGGFNVYERNASSLNEIFQNQPKFASKFGFNHPDFQAVFMNSLAEVFMNSLAEIYQKIVKGTPDMLKPEDITSMEEMVEDMEHMGLQLSWLTEMLTEVREKEKKRLLEGIDSYKQQLAKLEKKPRLA